MRRQVKEPGVPVMSPSAPPGRWVVLLPAFLPGTSSENHVHYLAFLLTHKIKLCALLRRYSFLDLSMSTLAQWKS